MNARLRTEGGHIWIECEYDAETQKLGRGHTECPEPVRPAHPGVGVICNPAKTAAANSNQRYAMVTKKGRSNDRPRVLRFRKGMSFMSWDLNCRVFPLFSPASDKALIQPGSSSSPDRCFGPFGLASFLKPRIGSAAGRCQDGASKKNGAL